MFAHISRQSFLSDLGHDSYYCDLIVPILSTHLFRRQSRQAKVQFLLHNVFGGEVGRPESHSFYTTSPAGTFCRLEICAKSKTHYFLHTIFGRLLYSSLAGESPILSTKRLRHSLRYRILNRNCRSSFRWRPSRSQSLNPTTGIV